MSPSGNDSLSIHLKVEGSALCQATAEMKSLIERLKLEHKGHPFQCFDLFPQFRDLLSDPCKGVSLHCNLSADRADEVSLVLEPSDFFRELLATLRTCAENLERNMV